MRTQNEDTYAHSKLISFFCMTPLGRQNRNGKVGPGGCLWLGRGPQHKRERPPGDSGRGGRGQSVERKPKLKE
jgi:hypothetical protein